MALLFNYPLGYNLANSDGDRLNAIVTVVQNAGSGFLNLAFESGYQLANARGEKLNILCGAIDSLSVAQLGFRFKPGEWFENTDGSMLNRMVFLVNALPAQVSQITSGVVTVTQSLSVGDMATATVVWQNTQQVVVVPVATSTWASADATKVTVASNGLTTALVTALGAGTVAVTATDPTTGITATIPVTVSQSVNVNGAQFVSVSWTSVSSLDSGRIGYVVGWGSPQEFGYAYTYTLSGAPAGVTIDIDAGLLSIASPLAASDYTFSIIVTNRENPSNSNTFSYTLTVLEGVTSGRSGTQVLHKAYDPHSGTYGAPTGNNWTVVLLAIQTAILADQVTNGSEKLRATIPFHKAGTYQYTNNHWLNGVQYYDVTATGAGAKPILQNNGSGTDYEGGPLNIGNSGSMARSGSRKVGSALINTVAAGATTVTCTTKAQVSRLQVGRWHGIVGSCIQLGGEPPNLMFIDYVRVLAVDAGTGIVTLDRPLKYGYDSTWWEDAADDISFGRGWICPWDTDSNGRATLRGRFSNIDFHTNPNGSDIMLLQSHIQSDFDTCNVQKLQVTMGKHYGLFSSAIQASSEPDKLSEMLFLDTTTTGEIGGATGFQYVLVRNSIATNSGVPNTWQVSPRQLRSISSTFNAGSSDTPPYNFSYNGPTWYLDFKSTVFTGSVNNSWTYNANPFSPLRIGTDGTWNGSQLRIPSSFANFQDWLINSYAGGIVASSGLGPITANWGYIGSVTSDGAGGALWLNIVWVNGVKPTSGTVDIVASRFRRLNMESTCSFTGSMGYANAKMAKQTGSPFGGSWSFPVGYPAQYGT